MDFQNTISKKVVLIIVLFCQLSCTEAWVAYENDNGKIGYKNNSGKIMIPAQYQFAYTDEFTGLYAFVMDSTKKLQAINRKGKSLLSPYFFDNGPDYIVEGFFRFVENGKIGFVDEKLNIKIPAQFDFVQPFTNGYAVYAVGGVWKNDGEHKFLTEAKWGYIDKKGAIVVEAKYDRAYDVDEDGTAMVYLGAVKTCITMTGKEVRCK